MKKIIRIITILSMILVCQSYCTNTFAEDDINKDNLIWNAEFDGNDDESNFAKFLNGERKTFPTSGYLENGSIKLSYGSGFAYCSFGAQFDDYIDFTGKNDITFEYRFMHTGDGELFKTTIELLSDGKSSFVNLPVNNGELYYGAGQSGEDGAGTGVIIEKDKWYTVKINMNFVTKQYGVIVSGDDVEEVTMKPVNFVYNRTPNKLWKFMMLPINGQAISKTCYVDYIRIYDNSYRVTESSISDGEENVRTDTNISIKTSWKAADNATFDDITVTSSSGRKIEREVAATENGFDIKFPAGLDYGEEYTLNCGEGVIAENGKKLTPYSIVFSTESEPLYVTQPETDVLNGKIKSTVKSSNFTTSGIKVYLFTAVYGADGKLLKLSVHEEEVPSGTSETAITNTVDVPETSDYTYKSFCRYTK
ncbi:MAG: Ig-like domain-containing protein [Clostridia bacterium]|nr:Ig-like domain-containing protein [Clostridia bacterium]